MYEFCKQCVDRKHSTRAAMSLEEADSSDVNDNNAEFLMKEK